MPCVQEVLVPDGNNPELFFQSRRRQVDLPQQESMQPQVAGKVRQGNSVNSLLPEKDLPPESLRDAAGQFLEARELDARMNGESE
jgi:hypothetical protein